MTETRRQIVPPKPQAGTRLSADGTILAGVDMRTHGGRRFRELAADLVCHLGDDPSAPQMAIIRRAAALAAWCEQQESAQALGRDLDIASYASATNTLRRLLGDLGLERRAKDVTPTLSQYLTQKAAANG